MSDATTKLLELLSTVNRGDGTFDARTLVTQLRAIAETLSFWDCPDPKCVEKRRAFEVLFADLLPEDISKTVH